MNRTTQASRHELNRHRGAKEVLLEIFMRLRPDRFSGNELGSVHGKLSANRREPSVSNPVSDIGS